MSPQSNLHKCKNNIRVENHHSITNNTVNNKIRCKIISRQKQIDDNLIQHENKVTQ